MNASASAGGNSSAASARRWRYSSLPAVEAAIAHDHAVRNADELGVRELDARTLVAIVEQHVDARGQELVVEAFCGFTDTW